MNTFASNGATDKGGAIYAYASLANTATATWTFINDTFFENTSAIKGGAAYFAQAGSQTKSADLELTSLTVYKNTGATGTGGVVVDGPIKASIRNSILSGNLSTDPNVTAKDIIFSDPNLFSDLEYNLVGLGSKTHFNQDPGHDNVFTDTPGLSNTLANNGAAAGYPQTLSIDNTSAVYRKGDTSLGGAAGNRGKDARGKSRSTTNVSIGAYDPDAS